MQAIITKYYGATNFRAAKIKASCARGFGFFSAQDLNEIGDAHRAACDALCARFDAEDRKKYGPDSKPTWGKPKASGQIPSGEYVFCFIPQRVYRRAKA